MPRFSEKRKEEIRQNAREAALVSLKQDFPVLEEIEGIAGLTRMRLEKVDIEYAGLVVVTYRCTAPEFFPHVRARILEQECIPSNNHPGGSVAHKGTDHEIQTVNLITQGLLYVKIHCHKNPDDLDIHQLMVK